MKKIELYWDDKNEMLDEQYGNGMFETLADFVDESGNWSGSLRASNGLIQWANTGFVGYVLDTPANRKTAIKKWNDAITYALEMENR